MSLCPRFTPRALQESKYPNSVNANVLLQDFPSARPSAPKAVTEGGKVSVLFTASAKLPRSNRHEVEPGHYV